MKKRLYLVRHGQTMFNVHERIQGWCDSPLTELGRRQAEYVRDWFADNGISFDAACCSTSERCSDTLEIITDMPYTRSKALKEMFFGELEGESERINPKEIEAYETFYLPYGGESASSAADRLEKELFRVMDVPENKTVLAVSHGGVALSLLYKMGMADRFFPGGVPNAGILVFDYDDEARSLELADFVRNPVK